MARERELGDGRPLRLDPAADSDHSAGPAFLARPSGAPAYHGFPTVQGADVEGFRLGIITDFLARPDTVGDAFIIAPDGSRAGLVWEAEVEVPYLEEVMAPDEERWGVWAVGLTAPLRTEEDALVYLSELVPLMGPLWEGWANSR